MDVTVEFSERRDLSRWFAYATPFVTIAAALVVGAVLLSLLEFNPVEVYDQMFVATLTDTLGIESTIIRAVPLCLAGLAVYLPRKAELWNIGAEGQIYMGAIAGTWVGLNLDLPIWGRLPIMFLAAGVAGAFWAGVPAWLRAKWQVNEIITTLLLTFVGANVLSYLVRGPMNAPTGDFPQTAVLQDAALLPQLPGSGIHVGILLALAAVAGIYLLMSTTKLGFEISFIGSNPAAATQAGMSRFKVYLLVFIVGGALAAMAGLVEIAGAQRRLRAGFEPGYGWTAIPIALLGRNGAFRVLLASLFFAVLFAGGSGVSVLLGVPATLIEVIQALIILFLITAEFFKEYRIDVSVSTDPTDQPTGSIEGDAR